MPYRKPPAASRPSSGAEITFARACDKSDVMRANGIFIAGRH